MKDKESESQKYIMKKEFIDWVLALIANQKDSMIEPSEGAKTYWEALQALNEKEKPEFTDTGKMILKFRQEHQSVMPMSAAREIGEGLFISSRKVSGAMRKLVSEGYAEKIGQDPTIYVLTEKGKNIRFEEDN